MVTSSTSTFSILWYCVSYLAREFDMKYNGLWLEYGSLIMTTLSASSDISRYKYRVSYRNGCVSTKCVANDLFIDSNSVIAFKFPFKLRIFRQQLIERKFMLGGF